MSYGLCIYGLCSYGLCSYGLCSFGLCSYGLCSDGIGCRCLAYRLVVANSTPMLLHRRVSSRAWKALMVDRSTGTSSIGIASISASPTACPLRGDGRAGTQITASPSTGTPIPAQWTCRRRCRYIVMASPEVRARRRACIGHAVGDAACMLRVVCELWHTRADAHTHVYMDTCLLNCMCARTCARTRAWTRRVPIEMHGKAADAALRLDLALGVRRRHAPKIRQKIEHPCGHARAYRNARRVPRPP